MLNDDEGSAGAFGLVTVALAACCGLPLLLGAGLTAGAGGLITGSGALVIIGAVLGVAAWRRRHHRDHCDVDPLGRGAPPRHRPPGDRPSS